MKKIILFGTFDFLHIGHIHLFTQVKKLGDYVIVAIARDAIVEELKGKAPIHSEEERIVLVSHIDMVDEVVLGDSELSMYTVLREKQPDIVAVGYDQEALYDDVKRFVDENGLDIEVMQLAAYKEKDVKSSGMKKAFGI